MNKERKGKWSPLTIIIEGPPQSGRTTIARAIQERVLVSREVGLFFERPNGCDDCLDREVATWFADNPQGVAIIERTKRD